MTYKVLDIFPIGTNTSVTIEGNGEGLSNGIDIKDSNGKSHRLLTVAMISSEEKNNTVLLIEGKFDSENIIAK